MLSRVPGLAAACLLLVSLSAPHLARADPGETGDAGTFRAPEVVLVGQPFELTVADCDGCEWQLLGPSGDVLGRGVVRGASGSRLVARLQVAGAQRLKLQLGQHSHSLTLRAIPGWLSLLPPLVAIALAIALRRVFVALLAGVWLGAWTLGGGGPLLGLVRMLDPYLLGTISDSGHQAILVFSLMLGGLIGLVSESGGGAGLARKLARFATSRARGQGVIWVFGVLLFFDDYVSTLLVGSSMRPLADRLRISREKLAFLADATSAPIASLAIASSWIGVELGYIADQATALGLEQDAYSLFLSSLPYRFYPLLMLALGLYLAIRGKDFGPMRHAEARAAFSTDLEQASAEVGRESSWVYAAAPIGAALFGITSMLLYTGLSARGFVWDSLGRILSAASGSTSLLVGASLGCSVAAVMMLVGGVLRPREIGHAWWVGAKSVVEAMLVLLCAWALGALCRDLHTANYLIHLLDGSLQAGWTPAVVFVVAAATSFATGSSWGTMGLIFPLAVPLAHDLSGGDDAIVVSAIGSILAGSVWGDHCSPISDTTIMSSMAAGCDHLAHVRTQLPYALSVGVVSIVFGDLATGLGYYGPGMGLLLGVLALGLLVEAIGRRPPAST